MKNKKIILGIGLVAVAGGIIYYGYKKGIWLNKKKSTEPMQTTTTTTAPVNKVNSGSKLTNMGRVSVTPISANKIRRV